MQCLDRINCNAPYTADDIVSCTPDDIVQICNEYLEATLTDSTTKGIGEVAIPKLTSTKWIEFKTALKESLSWIIGKNKIPLTYLIREDTLRGLIVIIRSVWNAWLLAWYMQEQHLRLITEIFIPSLSSTQKVLRDTLCTSSWKEKEWLTSVARLNLSLWRGHLQRTYSPRSWSSY